MTLRFRPLKAWRFLRTYGLSRFVDECRRRLHLHLNPAPPAPPSPGQVLTPTALALPAPASATSATTADTPHTVNALLRARFAALAPLPGSAALAPTGARVNIVTDSINAGSLFGGVGTAMILAALLARARGARLRVITRTERAHTANLDALLQLYGLALPAEAEFLFCPHDARRSFEFGPEELFLTTSWWTTEATLGCVPPHQILYLLQEDERMFYPLGDDHLRCTRLLDDTRLQLAVNTPLLLRHLQATGVRELPARAVAFEPAFPGRVYAPRSAGNAATPAAPTRRKLLFYARPHHPRNLFHWGLEFLDQALDSGLIDPARWDLEFFGVHIPPLAFSCGLVPRRHDGLAWPDYAQLMSQADLGLCLMDTPHPSYPPLDLAAAGAVVLTNRFGVKTDLSHYSANIVCADLDAGAMTEGLRVALALAEDDAERARRHAGQGLLTDWEQALAPVVRRFS